MLLKRDLWLILAVPACIFFALILGGCANKTTSGAANEAYSRTPAPLPTANGGAIQNAVDDYIGRHTQTPESTSEPTSEPTPEPSKRGNSTGNIVNGGLAAYDGVNLMVMNTLDAGFVNLYGGYAYYVNYNDFGRIYRQSLDGAQSECLSKATDAAYVNIADDMIFYRSTDDKYSVHSMNLDGSNDKRLATLRASRLAAVDGWLYFANWDGNTKGLWCMNYDGGNQTLMYGGDIPLYINVADACVWWISYEKDSCLAKTELNSGKTEFCDDVRNASCLNVYGGRLYFFVDSASKNESGLYSAAEDFSDIRHIYIAEGLQNLNIADDTVYFRTGAGTESTADDKLYSCTTGGSNITAVS